MPANLSGTPRCETGNESRKLAIGGRLPAIWLQADTEEGCALLLVNLDAVAG
jgi:hypothetical protein